MPRDGQACRRGHRYVDTSFAVRGLRAGADYCFRVVTEGGASQPLTSAPRGPLEVSDVTRSSTSFSWLPQRRTAERRSWPTSSSSPEHLSPTWTRVARVQPQTTVDTVANLAEKTDCHFRVCVENVEICQTDHRQTADGDITDDVSSTLLVRYCVLVDTRTSTLRVNARRRRVDEPCDWVTRSDQRFLASTTRQIAEVNKKNGSSTDDWNDGDHVSINGGVEPKRCDREIDDEDVSASLADVGQRPTKSRRLDANEPTSSMGVRPVAAGSSRPGKDDEAVDSVASPSRQPLDGDDSALGVGPIDDDLDTRRRQN